MSGKASLEKYGYQVTIAGDGNKAVEATRSEPHPDLILMGIDLGPGIDGTEAARIILQVGLGK